MMIPADEPMFTCIDCETMMHGDHITNFMVDPIRVRIRCPRCGFASCWKSTDSRPEEWRRIPTIMDPYAPSTLITCRWTRKWVRA